MNVIKDTISFIARINGDFQPIIEDVPLLPVYASVGYVIFIFVGTIDFLWKCINIDMCFRTFDNEEAGSF